MIANLKGRSDRRKGKKFEEIYGISQTKRLKKEISLATSGKNNPMYGKNHKQETIDKIKQSKMHVSLETRQKISAANKGRVAASKGKKFEDLYDSATIEKIKNAVVQANKNRKISIESRKLRSEQMAGKSWGKHKQTTKDLYSKQRKGISLKERHGTARAEEIKNKIKNSTKGLNAKTYNLGTNPLVGPNNQEIFSIINLEQFCRDHKLTSSHIRSVIKGKLKHHKNWRLKYQIS
jgi:hypothetical protein